MTATQTPQSLRLVAAERLSRLGANATGIERQDEGSERYAKAYGHTIVDHAPDTDVSGSVPAWDRPELGPWITDPAKQVQYDGIIFADLDRLGRNARHISAMRDWAEDHGKKLIIVSPPLQWPPAENDLASPITWDVLARLAEYELKAITKRNREAQAWLKANGFLVGRFPYGYRVVGTKNNKTLEPDPDLTPYVQRMFQLCLDGKTLQQIADLLDAEGAPTPRDIYEIAKGRVAPHKGWNKTSVKQILRNPIMKGTRIDGKGAIVLRVEPIIDPDIWRMVQAKMDIAGSSQSGRRTLDKALLAGVITCGVCGRNMFRIIDRRKGIAYYYCPGPPKGPRCKVSVKLDDAEKYMADMVAGYYGDEEHMTPVLMPGTVHIDEILDIEQQIQALARDLDDPDYDEKHAKLRAERRRLRNLDANAEPAHLEYIPSGKSKAEVWNESDQAGKRQLLLEWGTELEVLRIHGVDEVGKATNKVMYAIGFGKLGKFRPRALRHP